MPDASPPSPPSQPSPPPHGVPEAGQERPSLSILSLDDDDDFRQYIRSLLESDAGGGHDVRTVATPDEFYAAVEQQLPDVVLLDMKMGRWSGEEVLKEIRRRWKSLCVIVVTGHPSMDSMRQTFKQDVFDYLAKPFSIEEMDRCLAQAVAAFDLGRRPLDRLRQTLGRQIRMARTERELTLKELSEKSGVSVSQLSSVERGAHLPSLESLTAIAGALEQKASEWLAGAGF